MTTKRLAQLSHIRLRGFKSFADQQVELAPVTVLVGANASGKSNLFDAICLVQGLGLDMNLADVLGGRWDGGREVWPGLRGGAADVVGRGEDNFCIETTWGLADERITHSITCEINPKPRLINERLSSSAAGDLFVAASETLVDPTGQAEDSVRVTLNPRAETESLTYAPGRSLLGQVATDHPVSPQARRVQTAMRGVLSLVTPAKMRGYVPSHTAGPGLSGENTSAQLWRLCQDRETRQDIVDWLTELCAPELADLEFVQTGLDDVMLVLVESDGTRIPARSMSDGTLRFLGELMAIQTAPEGSLLLMEEIEDGLHPMRVHLLVEAIEAASRVRGIRVVATTHSPLVIGALSEKALGDAIVLARLPDQPGTVMRRLRDLPHFAEVKARRGAETLFSTGWLERAL